MDTCCEISQGPAATVRIGQKGEDCVAAKEFTSQLKDPAAFRGVAVSEARLAHCHRLQLST